MTNVVVVKQKKIIVTPTTPQNAVENNVAVKNTVGYTSQNFRIDHLNDVVEENPEDGYTLIYNKTLDKYIVSPPAVPNLDGGEF